MSTDLDQLQGTWHVTSLEADGQKMAAAAIDGARIIIKGNQFTSVAMGATYEGTVELRRTKKLKTLDLLFSEGPEKGNRNRGIYELAGDRWTICLATRGSKRPGTFATKPGTGLALETLEREGVAKPSRNRPARAASAEHRATPSGAPTGLEGEWEMVSGVFGGNPLGEDMVKWCKRITRGNVTSVVAGPQTMLKASFTLNNSTNPHAIDYLNLQGGTAGQSQAGIYELSGDRLKVCMSPPGQPRPADFSSKAGDNRTYTTWRLAKR